MNLPRVLTLGIGRNVLILKKQSPHIFFAAGVVGTVVSTVLACRATLKLSDTLDEIQVDLLAVKEMKPELLHNRQQSLLDVGYSELELATHMEPYTDWQHRKDLSYVYMKAGVRITKLYGPSVLIGAMSIGALTRSHVQLSKRNTALMAAYAAVQSAYEEYRSRVREQLGEERELDIYRGTKTEVIKNDEGKKEEIKTLDPNQLSMYAKIFDETSRYWEKDPECNRMFLQCNQNYANHRLHAIGHLFLNEVYDMLGIDRTRAGSVVGWIISKDGDNYVDFGMFEPFNASFMNGWERSIWLDFNVDGVIYDKI